MSLKDLRERGEDDDAYILVDWDRTLVHYESWSKQKDNYGEPIPIMVERVQRWLHGGREVRIFTARVSHDNHKLNIQETEKIQAACEKMFGQVLKVQNWKCFRCIAIWDDLAVSVEPNTGWRMTNVIDSHVVDPLSTLEETELYDIAYKKRKAALTKVED